MVIADPTSRWSGFSASAIGSSHRASGAPNQDAVSTFETDNGLVVAISDGHGGQRYVRSADGSRIAVSVAQRLGSEALAASRPLLDSAADLPMRLVSEWRQEVVVDLTRRPLTPEVSALVGADPMIAYGATLLLLLFRSDEALALQLGDGDVVAAWTDGTVLRPVPADPRNVAGQTTSLCLGDAGTSFRIAPMTNLGAAPDLVIAATDGYGNSFADPEWPGRVSADLLDQRERLGQTAIASSMPHWVADSAGIGGDDTTVAVVFGSPGAGDQIAPAPTSPPRHAPPTVQPSQAQAAPTQPRAVRPSAARPSAAQPGAAQPAPTRSSSNARRATRIPVGGVLAACALVAVGGFVFGRSLDGNDVDLADDTSVSPDSTIRTLVETTQPVITEPRVISTPIPTEPPPTTTPPTAPPVQTVPPTTSVPLPLVDPRVRVFAGDGMVVDVDVGQQPLGATFMFVDSPGQPTTAVGSLGGWWTLSDDGSVLVQPVGSDEPITVLPPDDARGGATGLATSAGYVVVVLVAGDAGFASNVSGVTVVLFDGQKLEAVDGVQAVAADQNATNTQTETNDEGVSA